MKKLIYSLITILSLFSISCSDDENNPADRTRKFTLTVTCEMPKDTGEGTLRDVKVTVKDVNTGKISESSAELTGNMFSIEVNSGLYDITVQAVFDLKYDEKTISLKVSGYKQAVQVTQSSVSSTIPMFIENNRSGFVFAEIFFTGTMNPYAGQYYADKYFVIYNNSDETLYADSLAIAESTFMTVSKSDYNPDIMNEAMAADAIYMIPGNGKDYPVKPGESLLICDNALNHKEANINSFDLTKADFEWVDESTNPNVTDVNNPDVPDLKKVYCNTKTIWSPHNRGFKSYALFKMKTDLFTYLSDYAYYYNYTVVGATGELPMTGNCYKIPNKWIVDAVNLSVEALFKWIVVDPSLDRGWSYCGHIDFDDSRYGKCVRRKVESRRDDNTAILKDTNNSTVDFDPEQIADPYHKF